MKFVCAELDGIGRVGLVRGDYVSLLPLDMGDLVSIIEAHAAGALSLSDLDRDYAESSCALADLKLLPPISRFRRDLLCTGWNYWDHFEEGIGKRDGQEVDRPTAPTFFTKAPGVVIGPHDPIAYDERISSKWDYEAEIAVILGRQGRSIPTHAALDHVFGYCLANDVSQRDLQRRHGGQWLKGKSIDGTMPLGPFVVTADEIDLPSVKIECFVNGEIRQSALASQMAFTLPQLIAELSFGMTLHPGDVLLTGTPSGIGMSTTPPRFLQESDEVVVRGSGLGELRNRLRRTDLLGMSNLKLD